MSGSGLWLRVGAVSQPDVCPFPGSAEPPCAAVGKQASQSDDDSAAQSVSWPRRKWRQEMTGESGEASGAEVLVRLKASQQGEGVTELSWEDQ